MLQLQALRPFLGVPAACTRSFGLLAPVATSFHVPFVRMSSSSSSVGAKVRVATLQLKVGTDKQTNLDNAAKAIGIAAKNKSQLVVLPECFNCPYSTASFPEYAEPVPAAGTSAADLHALVSDSPSVSLLSKLAAEFKITLVGGSIPEREQAGDDSKDTERIFNTSTVYNAQGDLIAKHRKVHLFDIDVPGKIKFMESETLSPGNSVTVFDAPFGKVGLGICYDIRFPELAYEMAKDPGVVMLVYPGAFNTTTGPAHWELLQRARAVDNSVFVVTCSPCRNPDSSYQAWGHSSVISPWGKVVSTLGHEEDIAYADVDTQEAIDIREQIPVRRQRRTQEILAKQ